MRPFDSFINMGISSVIANSFIFFGILPFMMLNQNKDEFKSKQLKYSRVKNAYEEKQAKVGALLATKGIRDNKFLLYIRIFKKEEVLEVWVKGNDDDVYNHLIDYSFCANSGIIGPKRKRGDKQIPEGFYFIDRFNPVSNFHLSLGINYPNSSDRILGNKHNLGGDIFLHGGCATIGCVPITDDKIKTLYILAVEAKNHGQERIPVHIFPGKAIKAAQWTQLSLSKEEKLVTFWKNLKPAFDYFEDKHLVPVVKVKENGDYYVFQ